LSKYEIIQLCWLAGIVFGENVVFILLDAIGFYLRGILDAAGAQINHRLVALVLDSRQVFINVLERFEREKSVTFNARFQPFIPLL